MTDKQVKQLAEGLSEARKKLVLELPADGKWGSVSNRPVAKRLWWHHTLHLIDHKHCPEDANQWRLNSKGKAVRQYLKDNQHG